MSREHRRAAEHGGAARDEGERPAALDAPPGEPHPERKDFIRAIIDEDLRRGTYGGRVVTRFPPEPNGYLHIGHAKSIVLNFGIAQEYPGAVCHLRFDDTNPTTEDPEYVEAIQRDVRWLGYDWGEHLYFASDYFERMYGFAEELIRKGLAYVDSQTEEEIRQNRGTVTEPGRPSPYRDRGVDESLDLFRRMRAGEFPDGAHVLRAKIDMASPNMLMRDPPLYRIRHADHYRTGDDWCIYPLYDYAHPLEDAIECITHSLCTLEFENNRELYDWVVDNTSVPCRPRQYEFARLNLDYTVMSKRKLLTLVREGHVSGWDDPRMPTIAGLRRRGVTPEAIRTFCEMVGIAKADSRVDMAKLEFAIRDDLNHRAPRVLCVLRPLRVVITNYPESQLEELDAPYWPRDVPREGSRKLPFSRVLYIERDDFMEDPPENFFRLAPGREVRLRYAYLIRCDEVVKDEHGEVVELRCTYDPETRGGRAPHGRRVKGTIHWVSAEHSVPCEVRLYDRLFTVPDPEDPAAAAELPRRADSGAAPDPGMGSGAATRRIPESGAAPHPEARRETASHPAELGTAPNPEARPEIATYRGAEAPNREERDHRGRRRAGLESGRAGTAPARAAAGHRSEPGRKDGGENGAADGIGDFRRFLNPDSLVVLKDARIEPAVAQDPPGSRYQFERQGYFVRDPEDSRPGRLVFNRTVTLRDSWAKMTRMAMPGGGVRPDAQRHSPEPRVTRAGDEGAEPAQEDRSADRDDATSPRRSATRPPPDREERITRYTSALGLDANDADIVTRDAAVADFFDAALEPGASPRSVANWLIHELPRELKGRSVADLPFTGKQLGWLVRLVEDGTLSSSAGREVLAEMAAAGGDPADIVDRRGLRQINDPAALEPVADQVIAAHPAKVEEYRSGKTGLLGFFMGQVMARTGGRANPELAKSILRAKLADAAPQT